MTSQGQSHTFKTTYNAERSGWINNFAVETASIIYNCHHIK